MVDRPPSGDWTNATDAHAPESSSTILGDRRGQALTLEAITAAILLLTSIGFALQMTSVTPLSASTSSQHLENQLQHTGEGVLASAEDRGALREAVLYWNESEMAFHGSGETSYYRRGNMDNTFGQILNASYGERNIAYNVVIDYHTADGQVRRQRMVHQGQPSDHAVSASRTLALTDDERLVEADGSRGPVIDSSNFYAPDAGIEAGGDRQLYNLVRIEVIAWRI